MTADAAKAADGASADGAEPAADGAAGTDGTGSTEKSEVLRDAMEAEVVASYCKLKRDEWQRYASTITQWERDHTLDC